MACAKFYSGLLIVLGIIVFVIGVIWNFDSLISVDNSSLDSSIQTIQGDIILFSGIISGLFMIGFGFIVGLLDKIAKNTSESKVERTPSFRT